jgi:hypothetical protein
MSKITEPDALRRRMIESGREEHFTAVSRPLVVEFAQAADGLARVQHFAAGLAEMEEDDWRQFEVTPEVAHSMAEEANAKLAEGKKKYRTNYKHDASGPSAGDVVRWEADAEGLWGLHRWTPEAKTGITSEPPVWAGFSAEFFARVVKDKDGQPEKVNGRTLIRPHRIASGGALTNAPAMPSLKLAAQAEEAEGKESEMDTKNLATKLGLDPEKATNADVEKAIDALKADHAALHVKMDNPKSDPGACKGCGSSTCTACSAQKAEKEELRATVSTIAREIFGGLKESIVTAGKEASEAAAKAAEERNAKKEKQAALKAVLDNAGRVGKFTKASRDAYEKVIGPDADPVLVAAHVKTLPKVAPTGSIYTPSEAEAAIETGMFAEVDPTNPETDERLTAAAKAYAKKKGISVLTAARELTRPASTN